MLENQTNGAPASAGAPPPPSKPLSEMQKIGLGFEAIKPKLASVLPAMVPVEKFITVALRHLGGIKDVISLDRDSLYQSAMDAAEDGLLLNGHEAALTPRKNKLTYQPMVWGLVTLAQRSGTVGSLVVEVVNADDQFKYWIDEKGAHINHEPDVFGDRGEIRGAYAIMVMKDGHAYVEVMSKKQIDDVRKVSTAKFDSPWDGPFATEMIRKSVVRRLSKRVPMTPELERAVKRVDEFYDFKAVDAQAAKDETESARAKIRGGGAPLSGDAPAATERTYESL